MLRSFALMIVFATTQLFAQTAPAPATPDPMTPIAWMAGTWHGEVSGPDGKPTKIDTRIERELNGKAFNFSTRFDGVLQYQGFFAYDAAKKSIVFSYPSADGSIAAGTVSQKDDALLWDFQMTEATGAVEHYQVHVHRDGADDYTWTLFAPQKDTWAKLFEVHYRRTAA